MRKEEKIEFDKKRDNCRLIYNFTKNTKYEIQKGVSQYSAVAVVSDLHIKLFV